MPWTLILSMRHLRFLFQALQHHQELPQASKLQIHRTSSRKISLFVVLATSSLPSSVSSYPPSAFARLGNNSIRLHHSSSSAMASHNDISKEIPSSVAEIDDLTWSQMVQRTIPPLTSQSHKGSSGRVGIMGGSARYSGAPYYASMAALKVGSDLATVFCASEASTPIKCYSPELMVSPVYQASQFDSLVKNGKTQSDEGRSLVEEMVDMVAQMIDSLHVLVIGPGLGRCPLVLEAASQIIRIAMERNLALVLDADALFLLTLPEYHNLLQTPPSSVATSIVVLTPNAMELQRLEDMDGHWDKDRVIVVQKGQIDVVSYYALGQANEIRCSETGGFKRSGGIGDLLAGTVGTFLAWNSMMTKSGTASRLDAPLACWMACCLIKRSTKEAFQQHHRAMTAPDVLRVIGPTFSKMTQ